MIGHEHDEPLVLRPVQPTASELMNALALEQVRVDALRIELGYGPESRTHRYTREELERGRSLGLAAFIGPDNDLVTKLES